MARIFYFEATGRIYGVHPRPHTQDCIKLPEGVAWVDVPEDSDKIKWPSTAGEHGCYVDPTTQAIKVDVTRFAEAAQRAGARREVQAMILYDLRNRLGHEPTPAERQAALDAYIRAFQEA